MRAVREFTTDDVVLLWDGLKAHIHPTPLPPGVEVITLPPGTTSLLQPMDQGVIHSLKRRYRSNILERIIHNIDTFSTRQEKALTKPRGTAGIDDGVDANVLDVCKIIRCEWNSLDRMFYDIELLHQIWNTPDVGERIASMSAFCKATTNIDG